MRPDPGTGEDAFRHGGMFMLPRLPAADTAIKVVGRFQNHNARRGWLVAVSLRQRPPQVRRSRPQQRDRSRHLASQDSVEAANSTRYMIALAAIGIGAFQREQRAESDDPARREITAARQ